KIHESEMRSQKLALPLYPFVFAAFVRRWGIPPDCKITQEITGNIVPRRRHKGLPFRLCSRKEFTTIR
ncbi:MAG TPA: hypothetical protein VD840_13905, partial [Sinorhizobium sp.]|nr:hypothetical protein [Sinorhizobium sp.]